VLKGNQGDKIRLDYNTLTVEKSSPKMWPIFVIFKRTHPLLSSLSTSLEASSQLVLAALVVATKTNADKRSTAVLELIIFKLEAKTVDGLWKD
jgi:hypothetical protein